MVLGQRIKEIRQKAGMTQEEFANEIAVSRQAVTKWETEKGIPDIENLIVISQKFGVSIDYLLGNESVDIKDKDNQESVVEKSNYNVDESKNEQKIISKLDYEQIKSLVNKKCSVELNAWNDGFFDSYIAGVNQEFLYYVTPDKKQPKVGMLFIKYIEEIRLSEKKDPKAFDVSEYNSIECNYFIGKKADVNLHSKHFWSGIIGESTEYSDVVIKEFSKNSITVIADNVFDVVIPIEKVVTIELK